MSSHRPDPVAGDGERSLPAPSSDELAASLDADGQRRFEALKGLRNGLRDGKPAYVVFDNKTLVAIARQVPASKSELSRSPASARPSSISTAMPCSPSSPHLGRHRCQAPMYDLAV